MTQKSKPPKKPRISRKLKRAIAHNIENDLIPEDACEKAGLTLKTWHDAMKRPHVKAYFTEQIDEFAARSGLSEGQLRNRLIEALLRIVENPDEPAGLTIRAAQLLQRVLKSSDDRNREPSGADADPGEYGGYVYKRPDGMH